MKIMDFSRFGKKALSFSLLLTIVSAYSMVTLATSTKPVGELIVSGGNSAVTVNGEPAASGRTIFSASTITTPEGVSAVINMGKAGKIELAPNTTFVIDGDGNIVSGSLTAGNLTVLDSEKGVGVKTLSGETVMLSSGETVGSESAVPQQTGNKKGTVVIPIIGAVSIWVLIATGLAVAAVAVAVSASTSDNNPGGVPISPTR